MGTSTPVAVVAVTAVLAAAAPARAGDIPGYIKPDAFADTEVTVGKEPWALPATLSMPKGDGPFPAVVLVHGSGPQDRDETIAGAFGLPAAKPFRDIAGGLASAGIAVLRYEKRTKAHTKRFVEHVGKHPADLSPQFETIDDAVAALELLRAAPGVDPKRVFLLGHSLGGGLAPAVAQRDGKVAGLVILAGMCRPTADAIPDQLRHLRTLPGGDRNVPEPLLNAVNEACDLLRSRKYPPTAKLLGPPLDYWAKIDDHLPAAHPEGLRRPVLVLHAGRDYQVNAADLAAWRKLLDGRKDVLLREHPACNHLFIEGEGPSGPADYAKGGTVSARVIDDIVAFLRTGRP